MTAYYNEIDPFAAAWLRELIKEGVIAPGDVDERSIEDVTPDDLRPYTQCHFFAGIGGWSRALRLVGVPDDSPVWTGSCPCQPFSTAGKGGGFADERHLWPAFLWHVQQCRPSVVFGEQVASADALRWWDVVATDLEESDYACAAVDLCAAGVGAVHNRSRLYWVANSMQPGFSARDERRTAESKDVELAWGEFARVHAARDWKRFQSSAKPELRPFADGLPNRVGALRGAGNAIVPQVAAEFIKAVMKEIQS